MHYVCSNNDEYYLKIQILNMSEYKFRHHEILSHAYHVPSALANIRKAKTSTSCRLFTVINISIDHVILLPESDKLII